MKDWKKHLACGLAIALASLIMLGMVGLFFSGCSRTQKVECWNKDYLEYSGVTLHIVQRLGGGCEFDEIGTNRHYVCDRCVTE